VDEDDGAAAVQLADGGVDRGQRDRGEEPERQPARVGDAARGFDHDDTHLPAG
jgi:hypothetical protein